MLTYVQRRSSLNTSWLFGKINTYTLQSLFVNKHSINLHTKLGEQINMAIYKAQITMPLRHLLRAKEICFLIILVSHYLVIILMCFSIAFQLQIINHLMVLIMDWFKIIIVYVNNCVKSCPSKLFCSKVFVSIFIELIVNNM